MHRLFVIALLLVGCDQVWQLERDMPAAICGPYGAPEPVVFHPELEDPSDFSVDSSGTRGMAVGRFLPRVARPTGVHHLKLEGGMWRVDALRNGGAITSLDGGHIAEDNGAVGWLLEEGLDRPEIREYTLSAVNNMWAPSSTGIVDPLQSQTSTGGNVIVLPYAGVATIRFMVTVLMAERAGDPNTMRIFQLFPGASSWELTAQADPLKTSKAKVNPSVGVMTADHAKLVYAAKVGSSAVSRLYGSERIRDEYQHGAQLEIDGVESDADLTQPWINADCSVLYFRRDDATWMATAVDDSASGP